MSFTWPEFTSELLEGARSWSATFDSYDQRKDDVYYSVTLSSEGKPSTFMVCVSAAFADDEWNEEHVRSTLRARIAEVATTGKPNTTYRGPVMRM